MLKSPYKHPSVYPECEHPRLMLRQKDIERIKNNLTLPENQRAYEMWQRVLKTNLTQFYDEINNGGYSSLVYLYIEAKAFDCLIYDKESDAKELIRFTISTAEKTTADNADLFKKHLMGSRFAGHILFSSAQVYDWLYKYLTEEQKIKFIEIMEKLASFQEVEYPPEHKWNAPFTGHSCEAEINKNLLGFSIAVFDERPDIYEYIAGKLYEQYYKAYNVQFAGGFHHQGSGYGPFRLAYLLWTQLLIYSMSDKKPLREEIDNICDSFYYMTRSDGESIRLGDDCLEEKGGFSMKHPFVIPMFMAGALTGNSHFRKYFYENIVDDYYVPTRYNYDFYRAGGGAFGEGTFTPVVQLIWNRLTEPFDAKPYEKIKHFPSPSGYTFYKNEETETIVMLKIGENWSGCHEHLDAGQFQIYHKGILASDSGTYDMWGTQQHFAYTMQTVAHNCLTILDPDLPQEVKYCHRMVPNSGGTKIASNGEQPYTIEEWQTEFKMAKVLSHTETDDLIELTGDLTPGYEQSCEKVIRKFIFKPNEGQYGILRVEDEVTSKNANSEKQFHLHIQEEPEINGNEFIVKHKGGMLKGKVIEPLSAKIEAVGGEGKKYFLAGQFIENDSGLPDAKECGWGQIIISPIEFNKTDKFVVEMEIMDRE